MIYRYEKKIDSIKLECEEQIESMQKQHECAMREATIAANEELRQMVLDNNRKLQEQAEQYLLKIEEIKQEKENVYQCLIKK